HFTGIVMGAGDLRLELGHGGGLSGLVTDDRGTPLDDFKIAIYSTGTAPPKDNRRIRFDSDIARESPAQSKRFRKTAGQFRLPNLSNGEWGLRITSKNHTQAWVSPVRSGDTDLKFAIARHAVLEGRVIDSSGQGLENGRVEVRHTDTGEVFTSYLNPGKPGEFTIPNITAGPCTVKFTSGRGDPKANLIRLDLSPGERRIDYVIPCHPPGAIHGMVDMEWHTGSGQIRGEGPVIQEVPISSRGLFRLDDMPAGTYQVQFTAIPKNNSRHRPGWSESVVVAPGKTTDIRLGPFGKGMHWTGQIQVEGRELGKATVRFVSLRGLHDVYEAPLDALGQFTINLPSDSNFAVLVKEFGTHGFRNPWFLLDEKFRPEPDQPGSWTLSTSRFQLNCVDTNGNQVHWKEDSPASDIRFVPDSVPNNSDYIAGHVLKGRLLPSVLPGSRYNVSGFVKDKAGRAWRVKGEQSFVAPANEGTREVTIVLTKGL
ncbi:MAG: carboxypeptidase-like regulatory domain-containing protein, partial [Planctomycetota bacterium]|nr:carboxypeptidase-like regulatory domain-containing protein [Planctomycetota bacterium]